MIPLSSFAPHARPRGAWFGWSGIAVLALLGCHEDAPSAPDLTGEWGISYYAASSTPCDPPDLYPPSWYPNCGGAGVLRLTQTGASLEGDFEIGSGCESCSVTSDYQPFGSLKDGRVAGGRVEFGIRGCRCTADVPESGAAAIEGTVTCHLDSDLEIQGSWHMTRRTP